MDTSRSVTPFQLPTSTFTLGTKGVGNAAQVIFDVEEQMFSLPLPRVTPQGESMRIPSTNNRTFSCSNRCLIKCTAAAFFVGAAALLSYVYIPNSNRGSSRDNANNSPVPTSAPTFVPTAAPSIFPTQIFSSTPAPVAISTAQPTVITDQPTMMPTGISITSQPVSSPTAMPTIAPANSSSNVFYSDAASYASDLVGEGLMTLQCGEREGYETYFSIVQAEAEGCLETSDDGSIIFNCSAEQPRSQMYMNANNPRVVEIKTLGEIKGTLISYTFEVIKRVSEAEFWLPFEVHGVSSADVGQAFALGLGDLFMVINQTFGDNTGDTVASGIAPEINTAYEATMEFLGGSIRVQVTNPETNEVLFDETHEVDPNLSVIVKGLQSYLRDDFDGVPNAEIGVKYTSVSISGNPPSYLLPDNG